MNELEWRTGNYANPRLYYLHRGNFCLGLVSMLGGFGAPVLGYSVYQTDGGNSSPNTFICIMPTLDEAKLVLQTIAGAQL